MVTLWEELTRAVGSLGEGEGEARTKEGMSEDALVEYEGTLITATAAQRRKLLSALLQRSARMHRRLGGGSLTLVPVLRGAPATGEAKGAKARKAIEAMTTLTEAQRERMLASLDAQMRAAGGDGAPAGGETATEVIEEFMSITDGQFMVVGRGEGVSSVSPSASVSRIGARAYPAKALRELAPSVRFELAQIEDEGRFGKASADAAKSEQLAGKRASRAHLTQALLQHQVGSLSTMEEEVCILFALQKGLLDGTDVDKVRGAWDQAWGALQAACPEALAELGATGVLTAKAQAAIEAGLREALGAAD